jgi:hypothetical protein
MTPITEFDLPRPAPSAGIDLPTLGHSRAGIGGWLTIAVAAFAAATSYRFGQSLTELLASLIAAMIRVWGDL